MQAIKNLFLENLSTGQVIIKNTFWLAFAEIANSLLSFTLAIFIARDLGSATFGIYGLAISLPAVFLVLSDPGLSTLFIRDSAGNKRKIKSYLGLMTPLRFFLTLFSASLFLAAIPIFQLDISNVYVVVLYGAGVFVRQLAVGFESSFRAVEKIEYEALIRVSTNIFVSLISLAALLSGGALLFISAIFAAGGLVELTLSVTFVWIKITHFRLEISWQKQRALLVAAFPFALAGIFSAICGKADSIILFKLKGAESVGWYNAAYQLVRSINFVPIILTSALFPTISRLYRESISVFDKTFFMTFKYITYIGVPFFFAVLILADKILFLYGKDFSPAILSLRILGADAFFVFLGYLFGGMLYASGAPKRFAYYSGIGAIVNLLFNFLLIPVFGVIGASITTVLTDFVIAALCFSYYSPLARRFGVIKPIVKCVFASILMAFFLFITRPYHLFITVPLGFLVYLVSLVIIGGFNEEDKNVLSEALRHQP